MYTRLLVIFALLTTLTTFSFAQGIIAIRGGSTLPIWNIKGEGFDSFEGRIISCLSPMAGLQIKTNRDQFLNLGGAFEYAQRKAPLHVKTKVGSEPYHETHVTYKTDFFHVYLYPEIGFGGRLRGFLSAGPYFGVTVGSKREGVYKIRDGRGTQILIDGNGSEEINSMDAGVRMELGGQFMIFNGLGVNLSFSGRKGLVKLLQNLPYSFGVKANSLDLNLLLGVHYELDNLFK